MLFSFQLKGHTHSDVDAAFGNIANHLRHTEALTMDGELWIPLVIRVVLCVPVIVLRSINAEQMIASMTISDLLIAALVSRLQLARLDWSSLAAGTRVPVIELRSIKTEQVLAGIG